VSIYCGFRDYYMLGWAQLEAQGFKGHLNRGSQGSKGEVLVEETRELNRYLNR
jgi:hypothetical protein